MNTANMMIKQDKKAELIINRKKIVREKQKKALMLELIYQGKKRKSIHT